MSGAVVTSSGDHHRGFHQCPNVLRDKYAGKIGVDGYGYINYLMSWANTHATLSVRRMMGDLGVSQSKLLRIQASVLQHCGHFIAMTPGSRVNANRWHLDMERLWAENALHLSQSYAERMAAKGVPAINTPPKKARRDVAKINTPGVSQINIGGVLICDTYKDSVLNTPEKTGVNNVTKNAREETPPVAPVAEPSPVPHTTSEASLSKDLEAVREPAARVAVLPPDGGAADAAITDSELELLFGTDVASSQKTEQAESGAKVPGGGAAARLAPAPGRGNALRPVDREDLLERPLAVPSDTVYRLVKGLIGGNKAIDDGILDTLTPAGALPRRDWLRLSEEELTDVRRIAQAKAQVEKLNFYSCAILALDVLIGAPVGQTGQRRASANAVIANAGCLAPAQHFEIVDRSEDMGKFQAGACWVRKVDDVAVIIERAELVKRRSTEGLIYHLSDGETSNALKLITGYEFRGTEGEA
ncbi:hypothetical protein GCM10010840_29930 [Deinococcus aerolatus]|uniref:Uncharacterized protein n=1 Tax=Deinococcus aerolatus TaxID=522487 RepID=A0ABQ2GF38_9DEIO|nr:hypothetical protein [Deinococcus aerolatus]GGL89925.1 hypothetical protein GCM10010840_29930 [Deinococcus aerolatus]